LAEERNTFLKHLASRGTPRSTLLRYARQLRVIAVLLDRHLPGPISREQIARHAQQWGRGQPVDWNSSCPSALFILAD
jgi:hypothetical protein